MVDDSDLGGLDPYDLMAAEATRLDEYFGSLGDNDWDRASRCDGWSIRDVLAHLTSSEEYNRACLDGTVQQLMAGWGAKGATDLDSANELGIRAWDGHPTAEVLGVWRDQSTRNLADFRARDGGSVDSSVGEYPARWQAFHLAFELATHADDVYAPVTRGDAAGRVAWQANFGRFALKEAKPDVTVEHRGARSHVRAPGVDVDLTDEEFVQALAARLPDDSRLDAKAAAAISVTP
jgi:uncharacterized protein (TIGR03083 family)